MIVLRPYKRPDKLGFAWADIIRPQGCACGWYGIGAKIHPINGRFECPQCKRTEIVCFPGITPDMLQ